MSLRTDVLDAVIDGHLGKGLVITRQAVIQFFSDVAESYTGVFLSNSEMTTGVSSPTYDHFTQRVGVGTTAYILKRFWIVWLKEGWLRIPWSSCRLVQLVVDDCLILVISLKTEPFNLLGWSPFIHSL